jgi:23S rRNA (cytidine1920-2'-O)/16S rRNA (cytidine1409-2'-O)-methyltransferase
MKKGIRLDAYLAENGLSPSREKAKREIVAGWVRVDGETVRVPSRLIRGSEAVKVERPGSAYASRGGEKLAGALDAFGIDVSGRIVADLGASTGGSPTAAPAGGGVVYAVDVGYGQLDYGIRTDARVVVMDRTNVRNLTPLPVRPRGRPGDRRPFVHFAFQGRGRHFGCVCAGRGVLLIKPQFEAGRGEHKKGVVRDASKHIEILARVIPDLAAHGIGFRGLCHSPIKGPAGNIEFFLHADIGHGSPLRAE